jgi:hypothetical protein
MFVLFRLGLAQKLMDQTAAAMVETFNAKVGIQRQRYRYRYTGTVELLIDH